MIADVLQSMPSHTANVSGGLSSTQNISFVNTIQSKQDFIIKTKSQDHRVAGNPNRDTGPPAALEKSWSSPPVHSMLIQWTLDYLR